MSLLQKIVLRIYDSTGLLPVNAVAGQPGNYIVQEYLITPFLFVILINPLQVSTKEFTNEKLTTDLKLTAELNADESVAIDVHRGFVCVQIPLPPNERGKLVLTAANIPWGKGLRVTLGLDVMNLPVDFNFANEMSTNLSFLGVPGSGKSVAMRRSIVTLVHNNQPDDVKFLMIEVAKDGLDLRLFEQLPHLVHPVITDANEAALALKYLAESISHGKLPYKLFVCIDEVAELVKRRPDCVGDLMTLISQGRAQNVVNLLATQLSDRDTLGPGKALFKQIHSVVLGKAGNTQLSYVMGNRSGLHAEELLGEGDLKLNSNSSSSRFVSVFTTPNEIKQLPQTTLINRLPLEEAVVPPPPSAPVSSLFERGAPGRYLPVPILIEGLVSLQRQVEEKEYREAMQGREYFVLPVSRVKELGRNPATFKDKDQPYLVQLYREMWKRGVKLCLKSIRSS